MLTANDVIADLRARITATSAARVADQAGISKGYLRELLRGAKPVSQKLAPKLGYSRVVRYARIETKE